MSTEHHEQAEIADEITLNYERMINARDRNEGALELTFEQRMNSALDRYADLAKFITQATVLEPARGV